MKRLRSLVGLIFLVTACELPTQESGNLDLRAAAGPGPGRVTLSWTSAADSFRLETSASSDFSSGVSVTQPSASPVTVDVVPGQTTYFRVRTLQPGAPWSTAQRTTEALTWKTSVPTIVTLTGTEVTTYELDDVNWVAFETQYTYKLEYSYQLRYDADGLTWTTQLHQTKSSADAVDSVEDSTFVSRGAWDVPWQSFTITEKKVAGEWVALATPVTHTLSTEDRTSFTLDAEAATWNAIP